MKRYLCVLLWVSSLAVGCTADPSADAVLAYLFPSPTITPTLIPPDNFTRTHTPTNTHTPLPTATQTPRPTDTPLPTDTPQPIDTAVPLPTAVPAPVQVVPVQPTFAPAPAPVAPPPLPTRPPIVPPTADDSPYYLATGTIPATGVNNVYVENPRPFNTVDPASLADSPPPFQSGTASTYSDFFQGLMTANGEIFDHAKFTAAHERLAIGTVVRVTALGTGKSVVVRINDRIPVGQPHIIDLTRAAGDSIGIPYESILPVRVDIVSWP